MLNHELLNELEQMDRAATAAGWGVWIEPTPTVDDAARELRTLAEGSEFSGQVVMLNGPTGLAPAITGCGPQSEANAQLICTMRNNLSELLRLARLGLTVVNMVDGATAELCGRVDP